MEKVIEDIKTINLGNKCVSFSSSVWSIMSAMGENVTIDFIMGITGGAFFHFWNIDEGDNCDLTMFGPEVMERTFTALGYGYAIIPVKSNQQKCIETVVHSINNNIPVLAQGLLTSPLEYCVISGYSGDGNTAIVAGSHAEAELIYKTNWTESNNPLSIITLEKQDELPEMDMVLNSTLEWIIKLARKTVFSQYTTKDRITYQNFTNGLIAFKAMIYDLEYDDNFPLNNDEIIQQRCLAFGSDTSSRLEMKRKSGAAFFRQMAEAFPKHKDDLLQIADLYSKVSHLWGRIKDSIPMSFFPLDEYMLMADKKYRLKLAEQIKAAKDIEEYAVEKIQKLLAIRR
ncbi:MAG: hypothetical protein K0R92_1183 [Lachnospiraceae bacterium]|jgi:hypothetical protein|nr:hypothetical protein [Lachnospiraceae bacterium]